MGKLIIFSAPSGSGKSTIINYLLTQELNLAFSISATSRPPRADPRNTKASGCQKGQPVDSYLPGILIRQDVLINKIYQADAHHCPQKKV